MRTGTIAGVNCTYPDEKIWSAERQIIRLERVSGSVDSVLLKRRIPGQIPWTNEELATYKLDANGKAAIDITDLARTYDYQDAVDTNTSLYITLEFYAGDSLQGTTSTYFYLGGIINPAGVYIPPFNMPDALVVPPERILYAGLSDIRSEFYPTTTTGITWAVENGTWATNKRWIDAIADFIIYRVKSGQATISHKSKFYQIGGNGFVGCDKPAAAVRWVSFTGVQRVHHFLVRKPTITAADNYQLLTLDNTYNEIKGRVDSLDLYIDELIPYDLWYYADVITSSKVEVTLDGTNWYQVQVTNKNVTIPTGEMGNGKLEITVNWRKYDAVTM